MLMTETTVNRTEGHLIGESEPYEPFTQKPGELYRSLVKEYGRCVSKMYIDVNGEARQIGWVFLKRAKYEDAEETYLLETWVTLLEAKDTVTHKRHHFFMDRSRQGLNVT